MDHHPTPTLSDVKKPEGKETGKSKPRDKNKSATITREPRRLNCKMLNTGRWLRFRVRIRVWVRIRYSDCMTSVSSNYFQYNVQTEQTRLIRHLLYGYCLIFFSVYSAVFVFRCCRLPYLWVSWFRFLFTLVRYSFSLLIYKQLSRKATLMFQHVLLF